MRRVVNWKSCAGLAVLVGLILGVVGCGPSSNLHLKADEKYRLAQQYLGGSSYIMAEQEIRKALDLVPHDARYYELLALIYQAQGRLGHADEAYRMALQHGDVPPSVQVNYSTLLLQRDRYDEAIALAQQALRHQAYNKPALAHTNIGLAYLKKGNLLPAEEHLRTALEYEPSLPEAHHNLGLVYVQQGKPAQAILSFREAIRVRPSYVEAHASLGQLLLAEGRDNEARDAFTRVIDLAPDSAMAVASRRQLERLAP